MAAQPNKVAFVTGASRGIGEALVYALLEEKYRVFGLSRSSAGLIHENYTHFPVDLSDTESLKKFDFIEQADHVLLVNNAGVLGEVGPVGMISDHSIDHVMRLNTIAPQLLMNRFIKQFQNNVSTGHILNISSGAGKSPIDGWAAYCASKAAMDLFSQTVQLEFQFHGHQNWHIHSIAPGVVDTAMQVQIRDSNPDLFKSHERFLALKAENQLALTKTVAAQMMRIILDPTSFASVLLSVRDL